LATQESDKRPTGDGGTGAFHLARPAFDGMTPLNRRKAAKTGVEPAEAQYRGAVIIKAFPNLRGGAGSKKKFLKNCFV